MNVKLQSTEILEINFFLFVSSDAYPGMHIIAASIIPLKQLFQLHFYYLNPLRFLNYGRALKGPYADHILIPQGSTGSSIFFDIKWKLIFFLLQIQNFSFKFYVVLEI